MRRLGAAGLLATASAGIEGLLGAPAARAATPAPAMGVGYPVSAAARPPCACETLCTYASGQCGQAHCPNGGCCYYCNGCGVSGHICLYGCTCSGCSCPGTCRYCT